ncbi:MAG: lysophospholipid acyltransferase family protein [Pseudomonadota bacterium]
MSSLESRAFSPSLWRRLVAISRLAFILATTLVIALVLAIGKLILRPLPKAARSLRVFMFNAWSRSMCWSLGGRNVIHGTRPQVPFFLASNHLGYLDIVVLAQFLPAVFVSKAEVRQWPFVGWLTTLADTLYINRERHRDIPRANQSIADALSDGDSVVLFPEGTSSESDFVLPIRPPLLEVAVQQTVPVHTVALYFETSPGDPHAHRAICYYGDMDFVSHVWRLLHLRGFTVTIRFGHIAHHADDRRQLARQLGDEILSLQLKNPPGISQTSGTTPLGQASN